MHTTPRRFSPRLTCGSQMIAGKPQHAVLLMEWLPDLDIPAMALLKTLAGQDAAQGARLLLMRRYARRVGLAGRQVLGADARRIEFAHEQYKKGRLTEW